MHMRSGRSLRARSRRPRSQARRLPTSSAWRNCLFRRCTAYKKKVGPGFSPHVAPLEPLSCGSCADTHRGRPFTRCMVTRVHFLLKEFPRQERVPQPASEATALHVIHMRQDAVGRCMSAAPCRCHQTRDSSVAPKRPGHTARSAGAEAKLQPPVWHRAPTQAERRAQSIVRRHGRPLLPARRSSSQ